MAWKELTTTEPGVKAWIQTDEIDMMQRVDPNFLVSDVLLLPGKDKEAVTVVMTKSRNKVVVKESPEEILTTN